MANALTHEGVPYQYVPLGLHPSRWARRRTDGDDVQFAVQAKSAGRLFVANGPTHQPVAGPKLDPSVRIKAARSQRRWLDRCLWRSRLRLRRRHRQRGSPASARRTKPSTWSVSALTVRRWPPSTAPTSCTCGRRTAPTTTTDLPYVASALLVDGPSSVVTSSDKGEVIAGRSSTSSQPSRLASTGRRPMSPSWTRRPPGISWPRRPVPTVGSWCGMSRAGDSALAGGSARR